VAGIEESDKWFETFVNRGCEIVNDGSVGCKMYITEVLCATCISRNRGHKNSIALSRDPAVR
jgi:hypothetical protein